LGVSELSEEICTSRFAGVAEDVEDHSVSVGEVDLSRRRQRQGGGRGGMKRHPAVAGRYRTRARPGDLSGGEQFIEHRRLIVADP
jgi:hypothetical protein